MCHRRVTGVPCDALRHEGYPFSWLAISHPLSPAKCHIAPLPRTLHLLLVQEAKNQIVTTPMGLDCGVMSLISKDVLFTERTYTHNLRHRKATPYHLGNISYL